MFASDIAVATLMNAIGSGAAGWMLDRTRLGLPAMLAGMAVLTAVLGVLWGALITMGVPRRGGEAAGTERT